MRMMAIIIAMGTMNSLMTTCMMSLLLLLINMMRYYNLFS